MPLSVSCVIYFANVQCKCVYLYNFRPPADQDQSLSKCVDYPTICFIRPMPAHLYTSPHFLVENIRMHEVCNHKVKKGNGPVACWPLGQSQLEFHCILGSAYEWWCPSPLLSPPNLPQFCRISYPLTSW